MGSSRATGGGVSGWLEIAEWDWVELLAGSVLHAVASVTNDPDDDWRGEGATECGRSGEFVIPGLFTRMGAQRCKRCCDRTSMPHGKGSPKNDDACRPVVEARIAAREAVRRASATEMDWPSEMAA